MTKKKLYGLDLACTTSGPITSPNMNHNRIHPTFDTFPITKILLQFTH